MTQVTKTASTAVASLQGLKSGLQNVQATVPSAGGDPILRLLRDGNWVYGQENIEVEEGSLWAINPTSLQHGWVSWTDNKKGNNEIVGEVMVPMTSPLPGRAEMRDTGWDWSQQLSCMIVCVAGEDEGEQVIYKTTSVGGMNAMKKLIGEIMKQLDVNPGKPVPVVTLDTDNYMHKTWGKTYVPVFNVQKWVAIDATTLEDEGEPQDEGQETQETHEEAPQAEEAPRRRRARSVPETEKQEETVAAEEPASEVSDAAAEAAPSTDAPLRRRRRR